MKVILFLSGILLTGLVSAQVELPVSYTAPDITGTVLRYQHFTSRYIGTREIDIWLPPDYGRQKGQRYPVIYMYDGQMLFSGTLNTHHEDLGVDEVMTRLITENKIHPAIVVGVWNAKEKRSQEYMPQKVAIAAQKDGKVNVMSIESSNGTLGNVSEALARFFPGSSVVAKEVYSDQYLRFLVEELKPFVDRTYRTRSRRADTYIMGSSLGALLAVYTLAEYPRIFGGAACMSTDWPAAEGATIAYLNTHLPDPRRHRIYFDYGTEEHFEPYQSEMDKVMKVHGYVQGKNWATRKFPSAAHDGNSWRQRIDVPLTFLLKK